jgi:hypothetical protein
MTTTPRLVAFTLAMLGSGAGCGGRPEGAGPAPLDPGSAAGIGDCVDPAPDTTRAHAAGVDAQGRVRVCRDDGEECRAIDAASGAMAMHYPERTAPPADPPHATVEPDGQLLVCWGQGATCLRKAPGPFETWLAVELSADGRGAALSAGEHDRRFVTILDHRLTTAGRFEVAARAKERGWWKDGRFLVRAADGDATRGHLYDADGTSRGAVGALGAGAAIDLGVGPVEVVPGTWAFLARDATAVAVHDLAHGDGVRIQLDVTGQAPGAADLARAGDGSLAVLLGGARYGDVLVVNIGDRTVTPRPATRCAP